MVHGTEADVHKLCRFADRAAQFLQANLERRRRNRIRHFDADADRARSERDAEIGANSEVECRDGFEREGVFLENELPASTMVIVKGLASPEYLVEIDAIAYVGAK